MRPVLLPANQPPDRFYRGGELIAQFRGTPPTTSDFVPEDWIASTTSLFGEQSRGLTTLPSGEVLREAILADPLGWLGPEHLTAFGVDTRLLVKLLHAGQRLPVHAHPSAAFARTHLGVKHGKVEAWHILAGGEVFLGLRQEVSLSDLRGLVDRQDVEALLGLMHRRAVDEGDTVYVPAGMLHAIGEGILLAELQEPEDLSILLEWRDFAIDGSESGHLGIGFDNALTAVDATVLDDERLERLIVRADQGGALLPPEADQYFRLDRFVLGGGFALPAGFAVVLVIEGHVTAGSAEVGTELAAGSTAVAPWGAGDLTFTGEGTVLVARPPASGVRDSPR